MKRSLLAFLLFLPLVSSAQTITTVAGNGTATYAGDGLPATNASIYYPNGVIVDGSGNMYIADKFNYRVRKVTGGIISTFAGTGVAGFLGDGGPASSARFNQPSDVAVDAAGNVYICDMINNRIRKVNTSGTITTIAGNGIGSFFGDGLAATSAEISNPWGITIDAAGNLYIADHLNYRVRKVNTSGIISTVAGNGVAGSTGDGTPATASEINQPADVWLDATGNLYITEYSGNRVRKVNTSGIISTVAGNGTGGYTSDGIAATASELYNPIGIITDIAGNIYIGDGSNNRVRIVNNSGIINTFAGTGVAGFGGDGGPATSGLLHMVYNLALDNYHNLYIADEMNERIRAVNTIPRSPFFIYGHLQNLVICENSGAASINSKLTAFDTSTGLPDAWSIVRSPAHGTAVVAFSSTSSDALITPTGRTYTPNTGFSGTDTFSVMVTNGVGYDTTVIAVTVNPLPNPSPLAGLTTVCVSSSITLTDTTLGGTWLSTNTSVASVAGGVVSGVSTGTTVISYTATNGCGSTTTTVAVTVVTTPVVAPITDTQLTLCPGQVTLLADTTPGGTWASQDAALATVGSTGLVSAITGGAVNISYTLSDYCGLTSAIVTVTVNPAPYGGVITGSTFTMCSGTYTTLSDLVSGGIWTSTSSGVATINALGIVHAITGGSTTISYTVTSVCGTAAGTHAITVVESPAVGTILGRDSICMPSLDTLVNLTTGGAWSSTNPSVSVVSSSGIVTPVNPGVDSIEYTITASGCTSVAYFPFTVRTVYSCTVGVPEVPGTADVLSVFPNPNSGSFSLKLETPVDENVRYIVTNLVGEKVADVAGATNSRIDVNLQLAGGIYFVTATTEHGKYMTKIVIN